MTDKSSLDETLAAAEGQEEQPGAEAAAEDVAAERDALQERVLRMAAELDNFKKRHEREKAEFLKRANESMAKDLLPVIDNLERALVAANEAGQASIIEGLELVHRELMKTMERHGLEPVEALGKPFDPEQHEAVMQQEDPGVDDNTVINELQKGYVFQGRLLRPAMVVVSKRPAGGPDDDDGASIDVKVV